MQDREKAPLEQELWERVGQVARDERKTVDELTAEALKRDLARRATQRIWREAETSRQRMTDTQIEGNVNQAVQDWRIERRQSHRACPVRVVATERRTMTTAACPA